MVDMLSRKYRINPDTLRVEVDKRPVKQRVVIGLVISALVLSSAIGMRVLYDQHAKSPRLVYYEKQNDQLRKDYNDLRQELSLDEDKLAVLQRKDDRLYRSIFGMEPLPPSIREAGMGGALRHTSLQSISNPDMVIDVFDKIDQVLTKAMIQSSSFNVLEEAAEEQQQLLASKPLIQPISPADQYWLTSTFGYRKDPFTKTRRAHHGIDLAGQYGLKIYATGDGVVDIAGYNRHGYGNEIVVDHGFGYESRYAHLQEIYVESGDKVCRGQVIGTLGSSGRSTGPHLHYEIRFFNKAINPMYCYYEDISAQEYEAMSSRLASE
jgi:murein DD-endopeptidase MepM/ murein hydrolase activator NlpD